MSEPVDLIDTEAAGAAAIRGGLLRTASFAGGLLLMLAPAPLLVRHLGDVDFGRYSAVLAVVTIVAGLTEGGVNTIALRGLSATRDAAERDRMMRDLLGLRMALGTGGVLVAVAASAALGYGTTLVTGTLFAALGTFFAATQTLLATVLQSRLRFGWAAVVELARQGVTAALIVALVVADADVLAFLAVSIPASLLALVLTALLVRGTFALAPAFHPRRWLPLLRDTFVFAVAVAVNTFYFRVALVLMSLVATEQETGEFAISFRIMEILVVVPSLLIGAAFPIVARTAQSDEARFQYASGRLFELGLMAGALIAVLLFALAPLGIALLTGSSDHPSVGVLRIQSAAVVAGFVASAAGYPLLALERYRETLIANLASLVAAAGLTLALAPGLGAHGAAIAAVCADFALALSNVIFLTRRGGPHIPLGSVPVVALAVAAGVAVVLVTGLPSVLAAPLAGLAFVAVIALFGRFPGEVGELIGRPAVR